MVTKNNKHEQELREEQGEFPSLFNFIHAYLTDWRIKEFDNGLSVRFNEGRTV